MQLRIATRKSELALWQANHVASLLNELDEVSGVELVPLTTRGDQILDRSLQKIGGKGLFIKELEMAMQTNRADIAVHSMKDVPADMPSGFCIAAVLERANPTDALVTNDNGDLDTIREGGCIGSSSLRRQAQLRAMRPDLEIRELRGNVNTRLGRLELGQYDGIILASAGLQRLGKGGHIAQEFLPQQMLPAAAQGVIGIECLEHQSELRTLLKKLEDYETSVTTSAERAVAFSLQATCQSPVASYATIDGDALHLQALVASVDGSKILREEATTNISDAAEVGADVANRLLKRGASSLLQP